MPSSIEWEISTFIHIIMKPFSIGPIGRSVGRFIWIDLNEKTWAHNLNEIGIDSCSLEEKLVTKYKCKERKRKKAFVGIYSDLKIGDDHNDRFVFENYQNISFDESHFNLCSCHF